MYLDRIPEFEYRRQYQTVRLRRLVHGVMLKTGTSLPPWESEFPAWARGAELGDREPPPYSPELVAAFELAVQKRLVSASMLRRLDADKLIKSGWKG